ncbi:MAG: PAS domain-containing protein, partial [Calditrichia bacterium]
ADGHFREINQAGVELFGYSSKEELLNLNIYRELYFNPEDRQRFKDQLLQQGHVKEMELNLKKKNGEKLTVLLTSTAVRDNDGNIIAYRGIIHDISERKRMEESVKERNIATYLK